MDPACYEVSARVGWMDAHGIGAQVLYPNLVAFEGHAIMALNEPELQLAIIRTYNDYLCDFSSRAPGRFAPICALPFWDIGASIQELRRCADMGYRGALWAATPAKHGLPATTSPEWDAFYATAQDLDVSINFHIGVGLTEDEVAFFTSRSREFDVLTTVGSTALGFMSNASTVTDLIISGVCDRFPRLKFVSVESGFGYFPFLLETLDWQWANYAGQERTNRLVPSEYFRRQIYTTFWFESSGLKLMSDYADNIMFETDFPHTTCLAAGLGTAAPNPGVIIQRARETLDPETFSKVMHHNAAQLYGLA
jgi:predicted TIM-barrel fold metal-dependent hydrolase